MDRTKMPKYKTIFSLRVREELQKRGIEPLVEVDNFHHPGYKCWKYSMNDILSSALDDILGGSKNGEKDYLS